MCLHFIATIKPIFTDVTCPDHVINIEEYGGVTGKDTDPLDEGTLERKTESETIESDGRFTCRLCLERLDGNNESKNHYIKEHKQDLGKKKKKIN